MTASDSRPAPGGYRPAAMATTSQRRRPRGPVRTEALLDAAFELLGEVGYDRLTIDAVAARAGASKTTIYRRWPDKRELVIAVLERQEASHPGIPADRGSLRADLLALLGTLAEIAAAESSSIFTSLLYASQHDEVLGQVMRDRLLERRRRECAELLARAAQRGELVEGRDAPDGDLLFEALLGQVITRYVVRGLPLDREYMRRVVDTILLPALTGSADEPAVRPPT